MHFSGSSSFSVAGIGKDDEERLRRFLPDWQKNSQLLLLGNKDGKVSYLDVSFLDPYDYWKKASGAFVRSLAARDDAEAMERITRGAMEAAGELLRPFKSEQLVSGAVTDILRNQDSAAGKSTTRRTQDLISPRGPRSDSGRHFPLGHSMSQAASSRPEREM